MILTYSLPKQIAHDWMLMLASPECDKLRKDGFRSSQYYSQSPAFSAASLCESVHLDEEKTEKKKKVSVTLTYIFCHCPYLCIHMYAVARKRTTTIFMFVICSNVVYNQFQHIIAKILLII